MTGSSANNRILTINGGSSSIKFALFGTEPALKRMFAGAIERIGSAEAVLRASGSNEDVARPVQAEDYPAAVNLLVDWSEERFGADGLTAVGHRLVHGGPKYSEAMPNGS